MASSVAGRIALSILESEPDRTNLPNCENLTESEAETIAGCVNYKERASLGVVIRNWISNGKGRASGRGSAFL